MVAILSLFWRVGCCRVRFPAVIATALWRLWLAGY